jgi:solute carrier family 25 carnitine/acylcarnitine transporter 20/29
MLSLTILNSAAFGLYGWCKEMISVYNPGSPIVDRYQYFIAGCGVGLASSFLSTPFEVVKVRLQHASGSKYGGSMDAARRLVAAHGPSVLFTGHIINTWREMLFCTVYFGGYENLKLYLTEQLETQFGQKNPQLAILLAGGVAGMLGWLTSYPLDVVKNMKQTQPLEGTWWSRGANSWTLTKMRWSQFGAAGFYKGIRPSLIRAFFVSGTRFSAFEFAVRMWGYFDPNHAAESLMPHAAASSSPTLDSEDS